LKLFDANVLEFRGRGLRLCGNHEDLGGDRGIVPWAGYGARFGSSWQCHGAPLWWARSMATILAGG